MNAVFVGSFDPFTLGHYEVVSRGLAIFDKIIVGVAQETDKNSATLKDRLFMAKASLKDLCQAEVVGFSGLATDFCLNNGCNVILRGIRNAQDFEYEKSILEVYKRLADIEAVYILSRQPHISSSQARLLARCGADLSGYVSEKIMDFVCNLYKKE